MRSGRIVSARHQFERRDPVWRRHRAMALVFEEKLEELAHLRIVLDDQDRASAASAFSCFVNLAVTIDVQAAARIPLVGTRDLDGKDRALAQAWSGHGPDGRASRPGACTMERPRPRPRLRSRAALSS